MLWARLNWIKVSDSGDSFLCNKNKLDVPVSQIYFVTKLYMFRTVRLSIIWSLFTVHSAMVCVIQVCRQFLSRTRMELQFHPCPARKPSTNLSIIRSLFTVHSAMVCVIQVCRQFLSRTRMELQFHPGPARKLSTNLYDTYHCWVYSE